MPKGGSHLGLLHQPDFTQRNPALLWRFSSFLFKPSQSLKGDRSHRVWSLGLMKHLQGPEPRPTCLSVCLLIYLLVILDLLRCSFHG